VTWRLRGLVALAVTLSPARATRLIGRLHDPEAAEALLQVAALAGAPRRARLSALAAAIQDVGSSAAAILAPLPSHPLLCRLELERRAGPAAERTLVRGAAARSRLPA
jgi:hypothetical protein